MSQRISRRDLIRSVAAGTGLTVLGAVTARERASATPQSPLEFHSPPLAPFRDTLPPLPRVSGPALAVDEVSAPHAFHRDLPPAPALAYSGADYLGPTIEAHSGEPLTLTVGNRITVNPFAADVDTTLPGVDDSYRTRPPTVLHLHGAPTPPASDGHPMQLKFPGMRVVNHYPNRQEATQLWYHDHAMGITRLNVYAGLAGTYLLRDGFDTGRADNPLGLPSGEFEMPLILQDKIFTADGRQNPRSTRTVPQGFWEPGAPGDTGLVNGKVWPELAVARGLYRFRVLNASWFSTWSLFFGNGMRFWVVGNDGGLLDAPVATTRIRLAPAERVDLLVDFSHLRPGDTVELRNDEAALGHPDPMPLFCRFRTTGARGFAGGVPSRLRGGRGLPAALAPLPRPSVYRDLTLVQRMDARLPMAIMLQNNLRFADPDIEKPRQGTVEQWNIINVTQEPHPIHLHLVNFRVLGRQPLDTAAYQKANPMPLLPGTRWTPSAQRFLRGPMQPPAPWEAGNKDTVRVDPGTVARILVRFPTADELGFDPDATFASGMGHELQGYVWHCHMLGHEDHEMMLRYRLVT